MPPNKPVKIIKNRHTQKNLSSESIAAIVLHFLRRVDRNPIIFVVLVAAFLLFKVTINFNYEPNFINRPVEYQLEKLNPDAQLYYSLAQNLVKGVGYYDTLRNDEAMPSIGHPVFLAVFCVIGGMAPALFSWAFFMLSFALLAVAVRIYCKSNLLVVFSLWLLENFFRRIWWYSANVETTIIFTNVFLAVTLSVFYRNKFSKLWAIISGLALYVNLTIRPLFLFPTHMCFVVFLALILYSYIRNRTYPAGGFIKGWIVLLISAESLIGLTYTYSQIRYHDTRLVTGTYGVYPLYAGNTMYRAPKSIFDARIKRPEEFFKEFQMVRDNPGMTWQQRHKILMKKVIDYWKQHPLRAITGWWWRFRQFLGIWSGNFAWERPLTVVHSFSTSALLVLTIFRIASGFLPKKDITSESKAPQSMLRYITNSLCGMKNSLGLIFTALFLVYCGVHAMFSYVGFRYASVTIPLLVVADIYLLYENVCVFFVWRASQ